MSYREKLVRDERGNTLELSQNGRYVHVWYNRSERTPGSGSSGSPARCCWPRNQPSGRD
jgi:hypothetical protein